MTIDTYKPHYVRPSTRAIDFSAEPESDAFNPSPEDKAAQKARAPVGQTPAKKFPHLEYASVPQDANLDDWNFQAEGEIDAPFLLTMQDLVALPTHDMKQDYHCITGWSLFDTVWTGILGWDILDLVKPHESVTTVMVKGRDDFSTCLWLEDFANGMMAWGYEGKPLSNGHGFPLRFIAPPHLYQYKSCKWVTGIEFTTEHKLGFWEIRAYSDSALVEKNDRYANPFADAGKSMGKLRRDALNAAKAKGDV